MNEVIIAALLFLGFLVGIFLAVFQERGWLALTFTILGCASLIACTLWMNARL